ncbi:MAG: IreB family regulatory phosphoprotein [Bacilli bacterium]|nr:IreB family regulatory phosphoprotein [Bacilli bacterium]
MLDNTTLFDKSLIRKEFVGLTLDEVFKLIKERGYDPINQILGYLLSDDLSYITNYKNARLKLSSISRSEIINYLLLSHFKEL